jgi:hypothetical protein
MDEEIRAAIVTRDEPKPFVRVKPLYRSGWHVLFRLTDQTRRHAPPFPLPAIESFDCR